MRFFINNTEIHCELAPSISENQDETLGSVSITLEINNIRQPLATGQSFRIEIDQNTTLYYLTNGDSVEIASTNPLRYKHTLSLIELKKDLTKHYARNSSFTQPATKYKVGFWGMCQALSEQIISGTRYYIFDVPAWSGKSNCAEPLHINENEKVSGDVIVELAFQGGSFYNDPDNNNGELVTINSLSEWNTKITSKTKNFYKSSLFVNYTIDGVQQRESLSVPSSAMLTGKFKSSQIKTLINQGANDLYISTAIVNNKYYKLVYIANDGLTIETDKTYPTIAMFQTRIQVEIYNYTAYDVLDLIIKRQKQESYRYAKANLFNLPTAQSDNELYTLLKNTIAPNFTFTQCTVFECVAEVFRLFDAIFTLDENKYIHIEYLNNYDRTPTNLDFSTQSLSISDDRRVNGFITYYQDARTKEQYPSTDSFALLRSTELGVPKIDDHNFVVPHNISGIIKVEVLLSQLRIKIPFNSSGINTSTTFALDVTPFVFEESLWSLLDTSAWTVVSRNPYQNNTVYWTQGDNKIQLAFHNTTWYQTSYYTFWKMLDSALHRYYGSSEDGDSANISQDILNPALNYWSQVRMRVTYITTVDGRTKVESITNKIQGDTLIDQSNGSVDLNRLGLNMLGVSMRTGEPTLNAVAKFSNWADRVKKGTTIQLDGDIWVANTVTHTAIAKNKYISQISFVKNFNALSKRINLLREKRLSNISAALTLKSEDNYIEYMYFTTNREATAPTGEITVYGIEHISDAIVKTFDNSYVAKTPDMACVLVNVPNQILVNGAWQTSNANHIYIPMIKYGLGNCVCFEMSYSHPMSAGNRTVTTSGWFGTNQYNTDAIKYADTQGYLEEITIKLCYTANMQFGQNFPIITEEIDVVGRLDNYKLYKQPNEIFAFNYELCFLPFEDRKYIDFVGSQFINHNAMVEELAESTFYLYYTTTESDFSYSILDHKGNGDGTGSRVRINSVTETTDNTYTATITFTFNSTSNIKTWSICDENGNIYFASNNATNGTNTTKILYFTARHNRL